ncbi:MAG TPA: endonuclease/exonuclease/phosphatase family protein [Gemmatimonadaceae bacterium]|nr:endonuclease/exonuclease/phosphatase family protein [Gemmatimonadaceae bacterium]
MGLTIGIAAIAAVMPAPKPPTFRVLEWNVSDSAWSTHSAEARAVLRHADPDVLVLAQVTPGLDAELRRMLNGLRGPRDTVWFISSRQNDPYETTIIAARDTIREVPEFQRLTFADTGMLGTLAALPSGRGAPAKRDSVSDVHANAGLVRVNGAWTLIVGVHLTCCGTPTDWREYRRQLGAGEIRRAIMRVLSRVTPAGVVVAGDMNLVAGAAALDTLLGIARRAPLGPMRRADARQPDGWTDWTWDGRGTAFNGGRLDNLIYSSGTLTAARATVWDTELMPPDTLSAHGLTPETSKNINRHRPVVVDLRFSKSR